MTTVFKNKTCEIHILDFISIFICMSFNFFYKNIVTKKAAIIFLYFFIERKKNLTPSLG